MSKEVEKAIKELTEITDLVKEEIQNNDENTTAILDIIDLKSLETVLGYVKELEKGITRLKDKNKKLSEEIIDVKVNKVTRNFIPKQEHEEKIKELEKERDEIYADYQDLGKEYADSVPKQVIRDKILYYKSFGIHKVNNGLIGEKFSEWTEYVMQDEIDILNELLESEK